MAPPLSRGRGIPRLQELSFLDVAARQVAAGNTLDQIRQALIDHMAQRREATDAPTGNIAIFRLARHDPHRYLANVTEALVELMRLDVIERQPLPSTRGAADAYQNTRFTLTPEGQRWVSLLSDPRDREARRAAYEWLLDALWRTHPQLASYLRLLARTPLVVPTARWTEMQAVATDSDGRQEFVGFLARRAAVAVAKSDAGWNASEDEIAAGIREYLEARLKAAAERQRPAPYPRHQDFVGACHEALLTYAFRRAGVRLDFISHEILRRWTGELGVANFSYHVPSGPALRLWATADLDERGGVPRFRRRTLGEWGDRVIDELPTVFERARRLEPGNSWVPVYRIRAGVCFALGLSDGVFDRAVQEFLLGQRRPDAPFRLNFDAIESGNTPPTERPLKIVDQSGRTRIHRVMALIPSAERRLA